MLPKIALTKTQLSNKLRIVIHEDHTTPLAACHVGYYVGSRDEHPEMTGMAHLMEHYMFCGSKHIADYDHHLQKIGAINNAYTSQDLTHYYITMPANNIETALWLESDRMLELAFNEEQLRIQKNVVMEEFKESYLNRPYGDMWAIFNQFLYDKHPYQWLPIGKELAHIEKVTINDMRFFFHNHYAPNNAVLTLAGNIRAEELLPLVEKWFADIPVSTAPISHQYAQELPQQAARQLVVKKDVPSDMLMVGWKICPRMHPDYHAYDLLSELLGSGQSSALYEEFITQKQLFADITACITGTFDEGLFIVGGRPADGISAEKAHDALTEYLYHVDFDLLVEQNLVKIKNRITSVLLKSEIKIEDRSSGLTVAELLNCAEDFEQEKNKYAAISAEQLTRCAQSLFQINQSNTLFYMKK